MRPTHCPSCGTPLSAAATRHCTECGHLLVEPGFATDRQWIRWPVVAGVVVLVLGLGIGGFVLLRGAPAAGRSLAPPPTQVVYPTTTTGSPTTTAPATTTTTPFDTGSETTAAGAGPAEAGAVTTLLNQAKTDRQAVTAAVTDATHCGDLAGDMQTLQSAAGDRRSEATAASQLVVDALPGGASLPQELDAAFTVSATADDDFVAWIQDLTSNCSPAAVSQDSNLQAAQAASTTADQDKQIFIGTWNPIAQQYGQPTLTLTEF